MKNLAELKEYFSELLQAHRTRIEHKEGYFGSLILKGLEMDLPDIAARLDTAECNFIHDVNSKIMFRFQPQFIGHPNDLPADHLNLVRDLDNYRQMLQDLSNPSHSCIGTLRLEKDNLNRRLSIVFPTLYRRNLFIVNLGLEGIRFNEKQKEFLEEQSPYLFFSNEEASCAVAILNQPTYEITAYIQEGYVFIPLPGNQYLERFKILFGSRKNLNFFTDVSDTSDSGVSDLKLLKISRELFRENPQGDFDLNLQVFCPGPISCPANRIFGAVSLFTPLPNKLASIVTEYAHNNEECGKQPDFKSIGL